MNITIKETGKEESLTIRGLNGIECTPDIINLDDLVYNRELDRYEMNQENFDWWKEYVDDYNADEEAIEELAKELGIEVADINLRIQLSMDTCDMGDEHQIKQSILADIRSEKESFKEMINDWKADHAEEMEDLEVDSIELEDGAWIATAHDEKTSYTLTDDGAGNIVINYSGTR